jgi:hypothetical protein
VVWSGLYSMGHCLFFCMGCVNSTQGVKTCVPFQTQTSRTVVEYQYFSQPIAYHIHNSQHARESHPITHDYYVIKYYSNEVRPMSL